MTKGLISLSSKVSPRQQQGLWCYERLKRTYNGLTKAYCPAAIGMTLETLDVKLHFFLLSWPAPTFCFETTVFIRWQRGKIFSFKFSWELLLRGISFTTCTYQSHQRSARIRSEEGEKNLLGSPSKMQTKWLPQCVRWHTFLIKCYIFLLSF